MSGVSHVNQAQFQSHKHGIRLLKLRFFPVHISRKSLTVRNRQHKSFFSETLISPVISFVPIFTFSRASSPSFTVFSSIPCTGWLTHALNYASGVERLHHSAARTAHDAALFHRDQRTCVLAISSSNSVSSGSPAHVDDRGVECLGGFERGIQQGAEGQNRDALTTLGGIDRHAGPCDTSTK